MGSLEGNRIFVASCDVWAFPWLKGAMLKLCFASLRWVEKASKWFQQSLRTSKDSISVWRCLYVHILFKKPFFSKILGPPSTQKVSDNFCGTLKLPNRRRPFRWNIIILSCPNSPRWISFRKRGVERVLVDWYHRCALLGAKVWGAFHWWCGSTIGVP